MLPIAREGWREILLAAIVLGVLAVAGAWFHWAAAIPFVVVWLWVVSFFRDPARNRTFGPGEICAGADGTVTEVTEVDHYDPLGGPAVRIGVFLSLFNVHVNRMPCSGRVKSISYRKGEFLDARHPESGQRNEANTLLIDPDPPVSGPVELRQVAGFVARRITCHANVGDHLKIGARIGLIKFGSRTEVVIPRLPGTEILVSAGDAVRAGLTILARQPVDAASQAVATSAGTDHTAADRGSAAAPADVSACAAGS